MSAQVPHPHALPVEPRRGLLRLRFPDYLEEQFRQRHADITQPRVRPLLVLAAFTVCVIVGMGLSRRDLAAATAAFSLLLTLPLLLSTLVVSYRRHQLFLYHPLLAVSLLCFGLITTSMTLRASLNGTPYYFAAEVALIFIIWLNLGLLFWYAAATALLISVTYVVGLLHWGFGYEETAFAIFMLGVINAIGALCCYQHEAGSRRAFCDKRILEDLAERDGLTGLYNRRAYSGHMERIWRQSQRDQTELTVMLIDIDHFKAFNDLYGHQAGDDALKRVAEVIALAAQRPLDFAARFGGEEFSLVLYGQASEFSRALSEQIREQVMRLAIAHAQSSTGACLTVSIGVCMLMPGAERSLTGAVQMADEALYQAKDEGRNRVVVKESRHTHLETGRFRSQRSVAVG